MQNLAKTLRNRIFKIGMFGRVEKDSFSFTERKKGIDGRLNRALAIENQVGASALICLATCKKARSHKTANSPSAHTEQKF